jgi:carbon-monoxide dehydrogenase medium subunit
MTQGTEVLIPSTPDEAARLFGDGAGVTVIGGGTIVLPEMTYGALQPTKALLLGRAGLAGVSRSGGRVTIGAATPIADLVDLPAPVGPCAANVADGEIRSQATLGGNLCAGTGHDAPRGDLQGALLAVDAVVRSVGPGGETSESLEEFLARRESRLLLEVGFDEPAAGAFAALEYPHTHEYTVLAVSGARAADGTVRLAATGLAGHGWRLRAAEAAAADHEAAGVAAVSDVRLGDDALASAWYREKTLPVLVRRVLTKLEEAA